MGRECLDLICLVLSTLVLSSDYLIHTVDTDYLGRATFMVRKKRRREEIEREGKGGAEEVDGAHLPGWGLGGRKREQGEGCLSVQA